MKKEMFLVLLVELVILSSFAYGFDISTPGDAQVGTPSFDYDFDFSISGILTWTYELIADFFGIPMEDMKIRGGNLFAFVLIPILLAYMMFYAIIVKTALFDATPGVEKWMPLLLALILAPLGIYRRFFFIVTAFMTTGTATLLYIFLFVMLLGYGLKTMFFRGVGDAYAGAAYVSDMRGAKKDMGNVGKEIDKLTRQISRLESQILGATKAKNDTLVTKLTEEIDVIKNRRSDLIDYQNSRRKDVHAAFGSIIDPTRNS